MPIVPDSSYSTLTQIRTKVRRLTRSPSTAQLTDADIDTYVNTFVLYDFPEHLRLFSLRTTFTFYAEPFIDTYSTNITVPTHPLYNFKNKYISVHPPVYIAGYNSLFSQSREQFFAIYPMTNNIASIGTAGDGVTTAFSGTLSNIPVLRNNVLFSSVDTANNGLSLIDDGAGNLVVPNNITVPLGTINYVTGAFTFTFSTAPASGQAINSQTVPYVASLPQAMLFYKDYFTLRPVPDQPYRVDMEVFIRPTQLLDNPGDQPIPDFAEWWQYISYGASKKVFEDRMDLDSVQQIMPEFKKQESLIQRRTIVQNTNERTATIYSEQTEYGPGAGNGWSNGF